MMRPIKNDNANKIDGLFRKNLKDFEFRPSDELWHKLNDDLHELKGQRNNDFKYAAIALLLLVITSLNLTLFLNVPSYFDRLNLSGEFFDKTSILSDNDFITLFNNAMRSRNSEIGQLNKEKQVAAKSVLVGPFYKYSPEIGNIKAPQLPQQNETIEENVKPVIIVAEFEQSQNYHIKDKRILENNNALAHPPAHLLSLLNEKTILELEKMRRRDVSDSRLRNNVLGVRGFHIGTTAAFNSTWTIMKEKFQERFLGDDINYLAEFGYHYGFTAGYDFSTKLGIQAEFIVHSSQGQKFTQSSNSHTWMGEIDMAYMHIPVMLKYKWAKISSFTNKPVVLNYLFGLQYSHLKSATVMLNNEKLIADSKFNKSEMGFVLGIDYDIFLSNNCFVTLGARGSILSEAKAFPLVFSSNNTNPTNVLVGLNAGFNYLIKKKHKNGMPMNEIYY